MNLKTKTYDGVLNSLRGERESIFNEEVARICGVTTLELTDLHERFNGDSNKAAEYYQDAILAFTPTK